MISSLQFTKILSILEKEFPKWNAPVVDLLSKKAHRSPYEILIATLLSLRSKDTVTSVIVPQLFNLAKTPQEMVNLPLPTLEKIIFKSGFYKQKAKTIQDISQRLIDEFNSVVPNDLPTLLSFKGIGRKTANLVLALGYKIPAICVDIHVHRISNRLGFMKTKTPEETEFTLMKKIPDTKLWNRINYLLVGFGQTICKPVSPLCSKCPVEKLCEKQDITKSR